MKHIIRKGLSLLGIMALLMTMLPAGILLVSAEESTDFDLPDGYTLQAVGTVDDLKAVQTGKEAAKMYYYLTNNIVIDMADWTPLGSHETTNAFWDILDGNGYSINFAGTNGSGVSVAGSWNGGLFFAINGDAVVKNLTMKGAITSTAQSTGAIVGQMVSGTIDRCVNYAVITAANKNFVGGIAGRVARGIVSNCMNYGAVTGAQFVGGLVGQASYSAALTEDEIASGVVKLCIANSANFGTVTGTEKTGGILGLAANDRTFHIENCYNVGTVSGPTVTFGAIVCTTWPTAVHTANCYAMDSSCTKFLSTTVKMTEEEMQTQAFAETLNANVATGIFYQDELNGNDKTVEAVEWQYHENDYPTIPMVETITPDRDLTEEEQMEVIRQKLIAYFLEQDTFDDGASAGKCYTSKAGEYVASQKADGHWDDVDYYCTESAANGGIWQPYLALDRMQAMAMAYANPDGEWYHDPDMLKAVENAFAYWASIRDANSEKDDYEGPWSTNWWENGNGVQLRFSRIGVVLKEELSESAIAVILRKLDVNGSTGSGQNALWCTQNALYRALIAEDAVQFKKVVDNNLSVNLRIGGLSDEAIQVDYTFHCHGNQLYTNGYGKSLFRDMSFWIDTLAGTDFAMPKSIIELMGHYMLDGTRWMIYGDLMEVAQGYTACDEGGYADMYIEPIKRMIKNDPDRADEYQLLLNTITGNSTSAYNGANGNNYMWTSALMSHMREGYGVNVRMNNKGMKSSEWRATWPDDAQETGNLIFWTADATASVMVDGDEYYTVYGVYDWRHIPGVTSPFALATHYGFDNDSNDSWGVSDGRYGATAYTFNKHDGTNKRTQGKVGYFFFDDEYVALGAGISANHENNIHTTMNQTKAADVSVNGEVVANDTDDKVYQADYVYNNKIGYVFPQQTEVHVSHLDQSEKQYPSVWGTGYRQFGEQLNPDEVPEFTEDVFSLWIDHGIQPQDSSYAYIVVPNATETEVAAYSESNPITIVANTDKVQAVRHEELKQTQINFYEAGTLEYADGKTVSADSPCSLIIDESGNTPVISEAVSNTRGNTLVNVSLTVGEEYTVTRFCSLDEPYAGRSITQAAGGSSLMQSSVTTPEHNAANAFDKNLGTYWESGEQPSWISYDMRESLYVGNMTIHWGDEYATKYELQYSEDGVDWKTAYTQENGQGGAETVPFNTIGRYWRLWCTESSGDVYQIRDIRYKTSGNVALNKPVQASFTYNNTMPPSFVVDGDPATRWAGERSQDKNWIYVDLGMNTRLDGVRINWEAAYAAQYTIDISEDAQSWRTVKAVDSKGGIEQTALPAGTTGRYLRIQCVKAALFQYGMSIWELEVYGSLQMDSDNVALNKPAIDDAGASAIAVTDGDAATIWTSDSERNTLTIDLGENHQLDCVEVEWDEDYATGYRWQLSFDGKTFSDAAVVEQGAGGTEFAALDLNARYVRLVLEESAVHGYAVAEVRVYGAAISQLNPDKSALKQAIDTRVRSDVYTQESYAVYQNALAVANNVYTSTLATKNMVEDATQNLLDAIDKLTFRYFGEVLATIPDQTATKTKATDILNLNWTNLSQQVDLSKEDLSKIYFFAMVNITRDPNEEASGLLGNGQIRLRSADADGKERSVYCNTKTLDLHLGENILYFPLANMITVNADNGMDWSTLNRFRMYIDSVNKFDGSMTMTLSDVQIIRTSEPTKVKVACVGDSITAGSGASSASNNYVSQLQNRLGSQYIVQNFGNSGKTLLKEDANGYTKTDTYKNSVAFAPDVVTIMLGTNDSKDAVWNAYGDKYEQELRELVQAYRDLPSHPLVILATSPTAYNRNWTINNEVITNEIVPAQRRVATEMNCPLIDANTATQNMADKFADGIHPNDAGYVVLADLFAKDITAASTGVYGFTLAGQTGVVDSEKGTIAVTLPADADLTALEPQFQLMAGATVSPAGTADFTKPVTYTVTSPDLKTTKIYTVTVTKEASVVNKNALKAALDAEVIDLSGYTEETAAAYTAALNEAKAMYANEAATQEQVDKATQDLLAAQQALVKKPVYTLGDVNGDGKVEAADALLALQAATSKITLSETQCLAANVDKQGQVTAADALLILQFATQKITHF